MYSDVGLQAAAFEAEAKMTVGTTMTMEKVTFNRRSTTPLGP
jgi:hypothetical protein